MNRGKLLILAAALGVVGAICLTVGIIMLPSIKSYVGGHYRSYGHDRYTCTGSPSTVADDIAKAQSPNARAANAGTYYLRYSDAIVIVGPADGRSCTIRMESLSAGYNHGSYIFLGPGFRPGSPSGSSGGMSGGPGGVK
jgi:Domain of unknown function (DUF4247)